MLLNYNPIAFTAVKLAGYTYAGVYLNRRYELKVNPFVFGIVRTLLGLVPFGAMVLCNAMDLFLYLLLPVRFLEWFFVIYIFYERGSFDLKRSIKFSALGMFWSLMLDVPSIVMLLTVPGWKMVWC